MSLLAANLTYISEQQSTTPCAWYLIALFSRIFFNSVSKTNLISPKRRLQHCVTQDGSAAAPMPRAPWSDTWTGK